MTEAPDAKAPTMLTFAPMVDSELTRLLLRHYGVAHREADHLFPWVSVLTLFHGGKGLVPLLYGPGLRLTSPRPIAEHFDPLAPPERRLIPAEGELAREVEADWQTFNGGMGADTAAFAYRHLLPDKALMAPIFAAPVPPLEARLTPFVYPVMSILFRLLLRLSAARADAALARIRASFAATDKRVADGRPFLAGDRLTIGDLALASASAPLLQPAGYGAKMPPVEKMPRAMRAAVDELRRSPTAAFVQRLYDGLPPAKRVA
jgi:glutathione S-transferase